MPEIRKGKDFSSSFADVFVTTGTNVGENSYCNITFCRHVVENTSIPDEINPEAGTSVYLEAVQSITLPMSMARNMAQAILNAPVFDPGLVEPKENSIK